MTVSGINISPVTKRCRKRCVCVVLFGRLTEEHSTRVTTSQPRRRATVGGAKQLLDEKKKDDGDISIPKLYVGGLGMGCAVDRYNHICPHTHTHSLTRVSPPPWATRGSSYYYSHTCSSRVSPPHTNSCRLLDGLLTCERLPL